MRNFAIPIGLLAVLPAILGQPHAIDRGETNHELIDFEFKPHTHQQDEDPNLHHMVSNHLPGHLEFLINSHKQNNLKLNFEDLMAHEQELHHAESNLDKDLSRLGHDLSEPEHGDVHSGVPNVMSAWSNELNNEEINKKLLINNEIAHNHHGMADEISKLSNAFPTDFTVNSGNFDEALANNYLRNLISEDYSDIGGLTEGDEFANIIDNWVYDI